jgi:hypothetical protein
VKSHPEKKNQKIQEVPQKHQNWPKLSKKPENLTNWKILEFSLFF